MRFLMDNNEHKSGKVKVGVTYVSDGWYEYAVRYNKISHAKVGSISINDPSYQDNYKVNFGLTTRFSYDAVGLYLRYRLTGFAASYDADPTSHTDFKLNLPRFEAGIQFCF